MDSTSRSCSIFVAVGDPASTSQLPSPQGNPSRNIRDEATGFSPSDIVRSANEKLRVAYMKKRIAESYRTLQYLGLTRKGTPVNESKVVLGASCSQSSLSETLKDLLSTDKKPDVKSPKVLAKNVANPVSFLTVRDVDRERGKPLSKYDRNMMIFNWLQTLDDTSSQPSSSTSTAGSEKL